MSFVLATTALDAIGPIARTSELRARGVSGREIRRAVSAGEIVRIRQGVYAAADASPEAVHAAEHGGARACRAAAREHGLWVLDLDDDPRSHVWLGRAGEQHGCRRPGCRVRVHWDDGTARPGGLPPVQNVLLQLAVCDGEEAFFVALESALRQNLLRHGGLAWLSSRLPPDMVRLLSFARSDADSGLESLIRLRLHRLGIDVRTQVFIEGVGEVDILIGDRLIIEADGRANHADDGAGTSSKRHKDLLRDARAAARAYVTLRFDYAMIIYDWPTVEAAILAKIEAGEHLRQAR